MTIPVAQLCQQAKDALAAGDTRQAFTSLRPALDHPGAAAEAADLKLALETLGRVLARMDEQHLAEACKKAARKPDDAATLHGLGCAFLDGKLPAMAATVLSRANRLKPGREDVVAELVSALEELGRNGEALQVLRGPGTDRLRREFVCSYLTAFNALMCGDPKEARDRLPKLLKQRDPEHAGMASRLSQMVQRLDGLQGASALDGGDLRGWHFVVNGNVVLHRSPVDTERMRGRYGAAHDCAALCREGVERLRAALRAMDLAPPAVFFPDERDSRVLARAAAQLLEVPARALPPAGTLEPGLLVAYDLSTLDDNWLDLLMWQRAGQALWTHASCWTADTPFAADFTTYLYESNLPPWDAAAGEDELVNAIANAALPGEALADVAELVALCRAAAKVSGEAAAGALRRAGERRQLWFDSPVKSGRSS